MTDYIYARVSTTHQEHDAQLQSLRDKYPAQLVCEIASGAKKRPMLTALVESMQRGDRLIVAALDRLGRRTREVLALIEQLEAKGVTLISVREGVDYGTITGRLVTQILCSVAEMERNVLSERTKLGLANARAKGRVGGRKPVLPKEQILGAVQAVREGAMTRAQASRKFGLTHTYLTYLLADEKRVDKVSQRST